MWDQRLFFFWIAGFMQGFNLAIFIKLTFATYNNPDWSRRWVLYLWFWQGLPFSFPVSFKLPTSQQPQMSAQRAMGTFGKIFESNERVGGGGVDI